MVNTSSPTIEKTTELRLARQQALKYGKDLAKVYVAERTRREELEIAYQTLSAVFTNTPDGLIVLSDEHLIQHANPAFSQLVELPQDQLIGQPIGTVLHSYELLQALNRLALDAQAPTHFEINVTDPTRRCLVVNIARLGLGASRSWIVVLHDETHFRRLENQKAEFISIASHELRTPLTSIMGYGQLLVDELSADAENNTGRAYLDAILRGAGRLRKIIDELMQFAALNGGQVQPTGIIDFALIDFLEDLAAELRPQAKQKQISLSVNVHEPTLRLRADAALLRMALQPLLLNGINFNMPGGSVQLEAEASADQVKLRVVDSGIGIPQMELEAIFMPFFQVEEHNTRRTEGLGLGLSIVRRATQLLNSKLSVSSKLGVGTTVTLSLPVQQAAQGETETLRAQLESTRQQSLAYARDMMTLYRQLQQTNSDLQGLNCQLEEADKLKSNFLGAISHELRSPFVSIDFALQTLVRHGTSQLTEPQRELLDELKGSCTNARRMIDNLVAYAGLLSRQGRLDLKPVQMSELIAEVVESIAPMAKARRLHLEIQIARGLMLAAADEKRVSEAIWHLIHNAIKFTPAGGQIVVQAQPEQDTLLIMVKDTGIGIAPEQQAIIWESFSQLSDALKRGVEGLGLGLALVRYVAAAHGGNVVLQSTPGVGTVIGFWLPMQAALQDEEAPS